MKKKFIWLLIDRENNNQTFGFAYTLKKDAKAVSDDWNSYGFNTSIKKVELH